MHKLSILIDEFRLTFDSSFHSLPLCAANMKVIYFIDLGMIYVNKVGSESVLLSATHAFDRNPRKNFESLYSQQTSQSTTTLES